MDNHGKLLTGLKYMSKEEREKTTKEINQFLKNQKGSTGNQKLKKTMTLNASNPSMHYDTTGMKHIDQNYNSCVSQALQAVMEMMSIRKANGTDGHKTFSADFIYGNRNGMNDNDAGMYLLKGIQRLIRDGCPTIEECNQMGFTELTSEHPYCAADPYINSNSPGPYAKDIVQGTKSRRGYLCRTIPKSYSHRPINYNEFGYVDMITYENVGDISAVSIKEGLTHSPVVISMYADDARYAVFNKGNNGYMTPSVSTKSGGGHALVIFDVVTINGIECFKIWNSWGYRGDNGCFYIPTAKANFEFITEAYCLYFGDPGPLPTFLPEPKPGMGDYYCGYYDTIELSFNFRKALYADGIIPIEVAIRMIDPIKWHRFTKDNKYFYMADRVIVTNISYDDLLKMNVVNIDNANTNTFYVNGKTCKVSIPTIDDIMIYLDAFALDEYQDTLYSLLQNGGAATGNSDFNVDRPDHDKRSDKLGWRPILVQV